MAQSTRATLATYCNRIARNRDAAFTDALTNLTLEERDNRVFLELADTFALAAQANIRTTELMIHLAALGTAGHETALLSFAALHKKDPVACERAVKAFAACRNKMVNEKQKAFDANVARVWGDTSIRISKAGMPELYEPKKRMGKGENQNQNHKAKRTDAHARAIIRAWRYRCELRAARAALQTAQRKTAKVAARKRAA